MQRKRGVGLVLAVLVAATAGGAATAVAGDAAKDGTRAGADKDMSPAKRKERIKAELGLDDATAIKLFAAIDNHRRAMKPLREELQELRLAIEEALAAKTPDEKRIADLLGRFEANRKAAEGERWLLNASVKKILTPSQAAKFLILMHKRYGDKALG